MAVDAKTGINNFAATDSPGGHAVGNSIIADLGNKGLVVTRWANQTARDTALGASPASTVTYVTHLVAEGRVELWDGTAWQVIAKLADGYGAPVYASQSVGAAGPWNNTGLGAALSSSWTWTPSKSGIARVKLRMDVQTSTANWQQFTVQMTNNLVAMAGGLRLWNEGDGSRTDLVVDPHAFRVTAGTSVPLGFSVSVFNGAGAVSLNSAAYSTEIIPGI